MTEPTFSQQYCTVVPYQAGGALIAGRKRQSCLIQVTDGELVIIEAPSLLVDRAPVPTVQIDTPAVQRKLGTSVFVKMNSNQWAIDFGFVAKREAAQGGMLKALFSGGGIKSIRRARELTGALMDALTSQGATSPRAGH